MRLIDADALKEKILKERDAIPKTVTERYSFGVETPNHHGNLMRGGIRIALRCMEQAPTIDAVLVVRCGECKHWACYGGEDSHKGDCLELVGLDSCMYEDDFCSYGERKDGDG